MQREVWFERFTQRLWEFHPKRDFMWDANHLGLWIDEDQIESVMAGCPEDPERAADIVFDQVVEEMEMRGEVYTPAISTQTPIWKTWLAKLLPTAIAKKLRLAQ